jgi:hypothetical protein
MFSVSVRLLWEPDEKFHFHEFPQQFSVSLCFLIFMILHLSRFHSKVNKYL